ncbi:MAG: helix-turn-helix domain-containing protein [Microbacterium sp.]|uniref:helix-turn-helix transcriptional regulator n=1 Tax=Microbacterium sp. TaxID=51671 RepID=UPI0039E46914
MPDTSPEASSRATTASGARARVLGILRASPVPLDAAAVAERLDVHVTTARFHLDRLADAGLVGRKSGGEKRRGRPRIRYAPAGAARDEDSRGQLIHVLAGALAEDASGSAEALAAGRRWADGFDPIDGDPVPALVDVLDGLGFDPHADGSRIRLDACPFRAVARDHPEVVCAVHRGLIERLLKPTALRARLVPFVEPELCLVALGPARNEETPSV